MHSVVIYEFSPENRAAAVVRFLETGGEPPEGVKMINRWHSATMNKGWTLAESDSIEAVAEWSHTWADLLSFEIVPVLDDEQIVRVLAT